MPDDLFPFRRFRLELDGVAQGAFEHLVPPGLATRVELGPDAVPRPGLTSRTHARLIRGVANTRELFRWLGPSLGGSPEKRTVHVVELSPDGEPHLRHVFEGAWPVRLAAAPLTESALFDVDELELVVTAWRAENATPPGSTGESTTVDDPAGSASEPG